MPSTDLAISEPRSAPVEQTATKSPRIPRTITKAIRLLTTGEVKTQKAAAIRCNITPQYLSTQLNKPGVRVFIAHEMRKTIASAGMRAAARITELMDAASEHVSLDASKHVLAIEGIKPQADGVQVTVNVDVKAGYVLDLRDSTTTAHSHTIEHKPLTDKDRG